MSAVVVVVERELEPCAGALSTLLAEAVSELAPVAAPSSNGAPVQVKFARTIPSSGPHWVKVLDGEPPQLSDGTEPMLAMSRAPRANGARVERALPYAEVGSWACARMRRSDLEALAGPALGRDRIPRLADVPHSTREGLRRCARAVTGTRVGVALGGAGAWGYAGAALMLELVERGIPIDLVGGASSGALIGAYYCVGGTRGIERIVRRGPELARSMWRMAWSSSIVERGVDADLGGARLEALEIPLLPIVTNLAKHRAEVVVEGTCGLGVRASVSAPGLFAPTFIDEHRYVDGAVTDNVPTALVESMGAGLVISGNLLPAAKATRARRGVLGRLGDLTDAFHLLVHEAGNPEPGERRLTYAPAAASLPLARTFRYDEAARVTDAARRDPRLADVVDEASRRWRSMRAPRGGQLGS